LPRLGEPREVRSGLRHQLGGVAVFLREIEDDPFKGTVQSLNMVENLEASGHIEFHDRPPYRLLFSPTRYHRAEPARGLAFGVLGGQAFLIYAQGFLDALNK
jgi:hypothetical protein